MIFFMISKFTSKEIAKKSALSSNGMNGLFTDGSSFFVAYGAKNITLAKKAGLTRISILG